MSVAGDIACQEEWTVDGGHVGGYGGGVTLPNFRETRLLDIFAHAGPSTALIAVALRDGLGQRS